MDVTRVYSPAGAMLGLLENAIVGYTLKDVPLSTAQIKLPADDPANALCAMGNEVEIYDNGARIERFRIITSPEGLYTAVNGTVTYKCEHVLAYLMDDVLFQYHEIGGNKYGGSNENTTQCINYILSHQTTQRWVLGTCAFSRQFQYSIENDTLLRALLSIPKQFDSEYIWTFDTTIKPWVMNLVAASQGTACEMRYGRNLREIRKTVDATELITRLYPLGYGEGVNQLTIKDVNNGVPYIQADTIGLWGLKQSIWADHRFEIADSLLNRAQAILEEHKNPYISYKVSAADLFSVTGEPFDRFLPGRIVRVNDQEHKIVVNARVTEVTKSNVTGAPGDITVTIANKTRSAADSIAELASRQSVNDLYANGATCIYQTGYMDNADKDHPATLRVLVPQECVRINRMRLTYTLSAFCSYSKGAEAGGGISTTSSAGGSSAPTTSSGGSSAPTTSAGGSSAPTTSSGGGTSTTSGSGGSSAPTTSSGGGTSTTSGSGGASSQTSSSGGGMTATVPASTSGQFIGYTSRALDGNNYTMTATGFSSSFASGTGGPTATGSAGNSATSYSNTSYTDSAGVSLDYSGSHTHSAGHNHTVTTSNGPTSTVYPSISSAGSHSHATGSHTHYYQHYHTPAAHTHHIEQHTHTIGGHNHGMDHTHSIQHSHTIPALSVTILAHTHTVSIPNHEHSITIAAHTHTVTIAAHSHTVTIAAHTHTVTIAAHSHTVTIAAHTHTVTIPPHTHSINIPDHIHQLIPGIFDGPSVSSVSITVDGNAVPANAITGGQIDLVAYLGKDDVGKITRGIWHTIVVTPVATTYNTNALTRIEATVLVQTFVRSQGGGDY